jgi:HlyD family secretion protein
MDIDRKSEGSKRKVKRLVGWGATLLLLTGITVGLSHLKPAPPSISRNSLLMDIVKRGTLVREVRGTGTLVPVEIRWVPALNAGRVEKILVLPGAAVEQDTILVELSNQELEQSAVEVKWRLKAAEAELDNLRVKLESDRLNQEALVAGFKNEFTQAELEAEADEELCAAGLVPKLVSKRSRAKADELKNRYEIEQKRLGIAAESTRAQLAVQDAKVQQLRAESDLKQRQVASLKVRAGIHGVLQKLGDKEALQVGQQLTPGSNIARVANPSRLKAEIRIPETQARDIQLGQIAFIDTRNGIAEGRVERIDPAVQNGTVSVDVTLEGELPRGARPDLTVEGTVQLEKLEDVLHVWRPVQAQPDSTLSLFKLQPGSREAIRLPVKLGRSSVTRVEVRGGLSAGDQVIVSDMSQWDRFERVRLN